MDNNEVYMCVISVVCETMSMSLIQRDLSPKQCGYWHWLACCATCAVLAGNSISHDSSDIHCRQIQHLYLKSFVHTVGRKYGIFRAC